MRAEVALKRAISVVRGLSIKDKAQRGVIFCHGYDEGD